MITKALAFLVLATIANGNDVIVGLKTDGKKFFDENRQANPALWRQMDNVTIKAPENEVIRRVVITDLRPDKDGDVKIVDGGEGQKNVTIELKSPTVLRGYEFHIEVYSIPQENVPLTNDQQSTTEIVKVDSTTAITNNPETKLETSSKFPDSSTDKIVPAILSNVEIKNSERQGRDAKNEEDITSEGTKELTSTTLPSDVSSSTATLQMDSVTENYREKSSDTRNKFEQQGSTISPTSLNHNFNFPAISGKDISNDQFNESGNNETRHVRDIEKEKSEKSTEPKLNPSNVGLETSTKNNKEAATAEISDSIPVEEKSENKSKEDVTVVPEFHSFDTRKYTSVISSKVENPNVKNTGIQRNVRGANEEQKLDESFTAAPSESTTIDINYDTSTLSDDDCITTETADVQYPVNIGKDNIEDKTDHFPIYLNNRQWNQRLNNPAFQKGDDQMSPGRKVYPAVLINDESTLAPDTADAEHVGNGYKLSPDHMENRNPKTNAIVSLQDKSVTPARSP